MKNEKLKTFGTENKLVLSFKYKVFGYFKFLTLYFFPLLS